jgi:hypothetical protein
MNWLIGCAKREKVTAHKRSEAFAAAGKVKEGLHPFADLSVLTPEEQ